MADEIDVVSMDVPLLIRVMEHVREEVKTDSDLHKLVTNIVDASKDGVLTMESFSSLVPSDIVSAAMARLSNTRSN